MRDKRLDVLLDHLKIRCRCYEYVDRGIYFCHKKAGEFPDNKTNCDGYMSACELEG